MIRSHLTTRNRRSIPAPRAVIATARRAAAETIQTQRIPVTLAERPHPFPSRTRKLSSPAPKILRGQPFGKIGRRRDFCVPADAREPVRRPGPSDRPGDLTRTARRSGPPDAYPVAMTAVDPGTRPAPPACEPPVPTARPICPYLAAADGAWRSTTAAREHRCAAVTPPALLAAEKQRRLCLTADHATLRDLRGRPRGAADRPRPRRRRCRARSPARRRSSSTTAGSPSRSRRCRSDRRPARRPDRPARPSRSPRSSWRDGRGRRRRPVASARRRPARSRIAARVADAPSRPRPRRRAERDPRATAAASTRPPTADAAVERHEPSPGRRRRHGPRRATRSSPATRWSGSRQVRHDPERPGPQRIA